MTAFTFNNLFISIIYLGFVFFMSHAFEVIQPQTQTVNPDGSALISCEHTANDSVVEDIRLYAATITKTQTHTLLCQKGMERCKNIVMYPENDNKCIFIILNIGEEAMNTLYECEITVKTKNDVDITKRGAPTRLLPGQGETGKALSPPPHPPAAQPHLLGWILIGVLLLMSLYSGVISFLCIRLRSSRSSSSSTSSSTSSSFNPDNSTYVEMKKGPVPRNPPSYI